MEDLKINEKISSPEWWVDNAIHNLYFFNRCIACTLEDPSPGYKNLYLPTHKMVCDFVQKWAQPGHKLLLLLSRGWLKSSIVTVGWLSQRVLKNLVSGKREHWLLNNATFSNSQMLLSRTKFNLEQNQTIRTLFKQWLPKGSYDKGAEDWTKDHIQIRGNRIEIGSAEGNLVSKHYNGGEINDDLVNWENSQTPDGCQKVYDWWSLSQSLLMPQSTEINLGTIWAGNDLHCRMMREFLGVPDEEFDKYLTIWHKGNFHLLRMGCFEFPKERRKSTFPIMFSDEHLHDLETQQKGKFPGQYLNDPRAITEMSFRREWMKTWLPGALPPVRETYFIVDAANKETSEGDYSAIVIADLGSDHSIYVQKGIQERITDLKLCERIVELYLIWQPTTIGIEDNKFSTMMDIFEILIPKMIRDGKIPENQRELALALLSSCVEVRYRGRKKEARVNALSGWCESGKILWNPDPYSGCDAIIDQLIMGVSSAYDDLKDALAYILDLLNFPRPTAPKKSELIVPDEIKMTDQEREELEWGKIPAGNIEEDDMLSDLW